jgi:hypothetical protein
MKEANRMSKFIKIAIIAVWVLASLLLLDRVWLSPRRGLALPGSPELGQAQSESWMGVYIGEEKVGYSHSTAGPDGKGGRFAQNRTTLRLEALGTAQEVTTLMQYTMVRDYSLKDFGFELYSENHNLKAKGRVSGGTLVLDILSAGQSQRKTIALKEPLYLPESLEPLIAQRKVKPGQKFSFQIVDPSTFDVAPMEIEYLGPESLDFQGKKVKALHLRSSFHNVVSESWIDEQGEALKETSALGLVMVKETREQALKFSSGGKAPDLLAKFAVPASMDIPEPRRARYLKVRIHGMEASQWAKSLADGRQSVIPDSAPGKPDSVLTLVVSCESLDSLSEGSLPLGSPALTKGKAPDLEPTPLIQVNDPRIKKLARDIVGGEKDSWKAVRKLSAWVYGNLAKKMTVSIPSALDVLESREGDCNEHATLFCALARAAGIPCRIAAGVVESEGSFYYHAWDLVYVGRWVAVDPTFGQDIADATHIKLIEGGLEKQVDLVSVMGRLRINVLEVR